MTDAFLDTNVLLRHLLADHAQHSPRATALLQRIEQGDLTVRITDTVVFETVFTLERGYKVAKQEIRAQLVALLSLPGIELPNKARMTAVLDAYVDLNIAFADAYHAITAMSLGLATIYSWDRQLDRVSGLQRLEP